jgi:Spy/CpxP family protein refolding chaperone
MTRRGRLVVAVTAATLLCSATAFAQGWGGLGGHRGGGGAFGWPVLRAVGLDDAQKAQIRQIFTNHRPQLQALRQQLMTAQGQVRDKLLSPTPPTAADMAPISQLRDQLAQERLAMALEVRNVLTPDQLTKAAQIRQRMKQLRQQMRDLSKPTS